MNSNPERVIRVEGLVRAFGKFRAVDGIDFDVKRGEVFGFLGANGAGKTTTIRILCGLLAPTAGRGHVLDFDIATQSERIKPKVGYMSQKFSLYGDLTVDENLDFYGGLYRISPNRLSARKDWAVEMAGLTEKRQAITASLSGGWKQRLALGAALLHEPELLFLDEPTAGVAPQARREFWDLIHTLSGRGTTVFVTSHYMDEVEHCDRIVLMSRGRIAAFDTPAGLKRHALGGTLFVLEDAGKAPIAASLRKTDGVLDVQPFGASLHIVVENAHDGIELIAARAREAGIESPHVRRIEPSLEDVFISVISRVER